MKRLAYWLLIAIVLSSCSKQIHLSELNYQDQKFYLNGKPYTGTSYTNIGGELEAKLGVKLNFLGDSTVLLINDGLCEEISSFRKGVQNAKVQNSFHGDTIYSVITSYKTIPGVLTMKKSGELNMMNYQPHGDSFSYYTGTNAVRNHFHYRYGELHGKQIEYFIDGFKKFESEYKDGVRIGESFVYYPKDNKVKSKHIYTNGESDTYYTYSFNGKPLAKKVDGVYEQVPKDGLYVSINSKGELTHSNYKDNKLHGELIDFWLNGNKKKLTTYVNGEKAGTYKTWTEEGELSYHGNYKNGIIIEVKAD